MHYRWIAAALAAAMLSFPVQTARVVFRSDRTGQGSNTAVEFK
jgi:hypothetical protein